MKNRRLLYLGYLISALALAFAFIFRENRTIELISIFVFIICLSITQVRSMHYKRRRKDKDYRIAVNDERAEKIRDKVNATMAHLLIFINLIIAVISLVLRENVSAVLLIVVTAMSPVVMFFVDKHYEKVY